MKIYLVGGAVRDELLGNHFIEKDYVVVGSTVEEMLALGYKQVGKDFPVFLHPESKEEYALARTERKTGKGYTGFTFNSKNVTLEEDLKRRDLTINAIAKDIKTDVIIDPYKGQEDLKNKLLRHVSDAFVEDPVRILRIARFAARFSDFTIHPDTMDLMKKMVRSGEIDSLVPERVWKEMERALSEKKPSRFFDVLSECGAMEVLFSGMGLNRNHLDLSDEELRRFFVFPQSDKNFKLIRFALLTYPLKEEQLISLSKQYCIPNEYKELAVLVIRYHPTYAKIQYLSAEDILRLLINLDAFRRTERFDLYHVVCKIIYLELEIESFLEAIPKNFLNEIVDMCKKVSSKNSESLSGKQIAEYIEKERLRIISEKTQSQGKRN